MNDDNVGWQGKLLAQRLPTSVLDYVTIVYRGTNIYHLGQVSPALYSRQLEHRQSHMTVNES